VPPRQTTFKKSLLAIERAFADIERQLAGFARRVRLVEREAGRKVKALGRPRRQVTLTPKRRAQLKLQGSYMGFMRQLGPRQKARVKAVKEKQGFESAIRIARKLATG
jgi:hypothetical protein